MAEILIKAVDAFVEDPEHDKGSYKKGDIVSIQPDGTKWAEGEKPPAFIIVKVPGVAVSDLEIYMQENREKINVFDITRNKNVDEFRLISKRKYHIPIISLNTIITAGGIATINKTTFTAQIVSK